MIHLFVGAFFFFRRERHAYNQMLRKEADFMRARGPQARVSLAYTLRRVFVR